MSTSPPTNTSSDTTYLTISTSSTLEEISLLSNKLKVNNSIVTCKIIFNNNSNNNNNNNSNTNTNKNNNSTIVHNNAIKLLINIIFTSNTLKYIIFESNYSFNETFVDYFFVPEEPSLSIVSISFENIGFNLKDFNFFLTYIANFKSLKQLLIYDNLDDTVLYNISELLSYNGSSLKNKLKLELLSLSGNYCHFTSEAINIFCEKGLDGIRYLSLSSCSLSEYSVGIIMSKMKQITLKYSKSEIDENKIKTHTRKTSLTLESVNRTRFLSEAVNTDVPKTYYGIEELDISFNPIAPGAVVASVLYNPCCLTRLRTVQCGLNEVSAEAFATALVENNSLIEWDFQNNEMGIEGSKKLFEAFQLNETLISISSDFKALDYNVGSWVNKISFHEGIEQVVERNLRKTVRDTV